jgi:hypothetical protein
VVDAALAIAENTPIQLAAAKQSEAQARARYDAGLAGITEVAEAQNLLAGAEYQDAAARIDVWRALLARAVAQGSLAPFVDLLRASGCNSHVADPSGASAAHHDPRRHHRRRAHGRIRRQPDAGGHLPDLDLPVIYVAQPYGGMSPAQMEGFITYYYEYHFLYINGIESVESKSIQNTSLLKLTFHPGTDMSEALAQTLAT